MIVSEDMSQVETEQYLLCLQFAGYVGTALTVSADMLLVVLVCICSGVFNLQDKCHCCMCALYSVLCCWRL